MSHTYDLVPSQSHSLLLFIYLFILLLSFSMAILRSQGTQKSSKIDHAGGDRGEGMGGKGKSGSGGTLGMSNGGGNRNCGNGIPGNGMFGNVSSKLPWKRPFFAKCYKDLSKFSLSDC